MTPPTTTVGRRRATVAPGRLTTGLIPLGNGGTQTWAPFPSAGEAGGRRRAGAVPAATRAVADWDGQGPKTTTAFRRRGTGTNAAEILAGRRRRTSDPEVGGVEEAGREDGEEGEGVGGGTLCRKDAVGAACRLLSMALTSTGAHRGGSTRALLTTGR